MSNLDWIVSQLKQQRDSLNKAIAALEGASHDGTRTKHVMSVAARRRIAAAQKARWAKWKKARKAA
jgi:hypothetical protein